LTENDTFRIVFGMISKWNDVIGAWPTAVILTNQLRAMGIDVSEITVRSWRCRGIPGVYWHHIETAAQAIGRADITVALMARLGMAPVDSKSVHAVHGETAGTAAPLPNAGSLVMGDSG
jgi:hypothetical protein